MTSMVNFHKEAHKYIGVPFRHKGRTANGLDCIGLIVRSAIDCGYTRYNRGEEQPYGQEPRNSVLQGVLQKHLGPAVDRPPQVNDVILMSLRKKAEPTHVGIITDHPNGLGVIHAYGAIQYVAYHLLTDRMRERIVGVYEWPEKY